MLNVSDKFQSFLYTAINQNKENSLLNSVNVPQVAYLPMNDFSGYNYCYYQNDKLLLLTSDECCMYVGFFVLNQSHYQNVLIQMDLPVTLKYQKDYFHLLSFDIFSISVGSKWKNDNLKFELNVDWKGLYLKIKNNNESVLLKIRQRVIKFRYGERVYMSTYDLLPDVIENQKYKTISLKDLLVWFVDCYSIIQEINVNTQMIHGCLGLDEVFLFQKNLGYINGLYKIMTIKNPGEYILWRLLLR